MMTPNYHLSHRQTRDHYTKHSVAFSHPCSWLTPPQGLPPFSHSVGDRGRRLRGDVSPQSSPWGRGENRWPLDTQIRTTTGYQNQQVRQVSELF